MSAARRPGCPLCEGPGGVLLAATPKWRVIRAQEEGYPAFYRVVWNDHVPEFSDLCAADRAECMDVVVLVEQALRGHLRPAKVNVASLGNAVPHLHWHVVARFEWDSRYPAPVWAPAVRAAPAGALEAVSALLPAMEHELLGKLGVRPENRTAS